MRALADELAVDAFVRPADLSDGEVVEPLLADAVEALGPIDVLVNNAGIQYVEPTVGVSAARIEKMFAVNVTTPFALQNAVLQTMLERGSGSVINIASVGAITPTPGMCHYVGSKAALAATSESLRAELKGRGVNILTVYPGPVATDMETTAREGYPDSLAVKLVPVGTPEGLAKRVYSAHRRKKARVVYPALYGLTRYFRVFSEWFTRTFTPAPLPRDRG